MPVRVIAMFAAFLLLQWGCSSPPDAPEEAVRAWLTRAELAAEDRDRDTLTGLISPDYADARGNERDDIDRLFRLYFLRQQNVTLLVDINNLEIFGDDAATATITVGMAATNSSVLGFSADAWRFALELRADGDDWRLIGARWAELGKELR